MQLNVMQTQVAKLYEEGAHGQDRALEDVNMRHDALFLFLLQEAETCSDKDDLIGRLAVTINRLQNLQEALETQANAAVEADEGNEHTHTDA